MIHKKKTYKPDSNLQNDDGTYTTREDNTNEHLLRKYFLRDDIDQDTQVMRRLRNDRF